MSMYDNLRRANAHQVAQFILHETEVEEDMTYPSNLEERCKVTENKLYHLVKDLMRIENEDSEEVNELMCASENVQQAYFELGIKAGITMAIGFELGDSIK